MDIPCATLQTIYAMQDLANQDGAVRGKGKSKGKGNTKSKGKGREKDPEEEPEEPESGGDEPAEEDEN